jgi:EAL domain-containing protein (putative c-di-GMP-specific phosphodiesterase class I)
MDSAFARGPAGSFASPEKSAFVRDILAQIADAGPGVVAVGIESREQAELLRELGFPQGQGFYFSPPVRADRIGSLLQDRATVR